MAKLHWGSWAGLFTFIEHQLCTHETHPPGICNQGSRPADEKLDSKRDVGSVRERMGFQVTLSHRVRPGDYLTCLGFGFMDI